MNTRFFLLVFSFFFFPIFASAETLQVGTIERAPFSFQENGKWTGFSIDVFEKISEINGYEIEYRLYQKFADMIQDTGSGKNDISVANISVTLEREKTMDFSYPMYDSGLSMMVRDEIDMSGNIYLNVLKNTDFLLYSCIFFLLFTLLFFRKKILFFIFRKKKHTHSYIDRIILIVCFFGMIINYNIFLVHEQIQRNERANNILTYTDIGDKSVGVILGATSEKFCLSKNLNYKTYDTLFSLYAGLKNKEIEIVIHDLPILEYYINTHPQESFRVIGDVFQTEKYAFLMPNDSPLKEDINRALLQMYSDGSYQSIFQSYFQ